jgi:hypothetical protein
MYTAEAIENNFPMTQINLILAETVEVSNGTTQI